VRFEVAEQRGALWKEYVLRRRAVECPLKETFFGGTRGGKTDGVLGKWALKER
jgi:hypothetical protein